MDREEILERAVEQIRNTMELEGEITEQTSLDDYDLDSLDNLEILMGLEDEFGVELDQERAAEARTVGDIVDLIAEAL